MVSHFFCLLLCRIGTGTRKIGSLYDESLPLSAHPEGSSLDPLDRSMRQLSFPDSTRSTLKERLKEAGLCDSSELLTLAHDFIDRPEVFSSLLQSDFGLDPISAHRTRAAVMNMIPESTETHQEKILIEESTVTLQQESNFDKESKHYDASGDELKRPLYKSVVVNEKAQGRRKASISSNEKYDYGLPRNYRELYPVLAKELSNFFTFMTRPSTASQEPPIKLATANVYLRHAKLFLGWYLSQVDTEEECMVEGSNASIFTIIPNKQKESADCLLEFILWLRTHRCISSSYEANFLRGLTKLLKFRFAAQSKADPAYGEKSFDDIPVIRELRKLHRDANKRQSLSPRSSDEDRKWLSWPEYLQVIQDLEKDLLQLIDNEEVERGSREKTNQPVTPLQREIATMYQQYLILSFLACVPDRQRTIRELDIKRSFVRDVQNGVWTIKHGPDDYKTGKTYGDRPPLVLSPELVPAIDDFLERWRPCLMPKSDHLFVQPRTGNPLTQDSVYQIVARSCYKYSGKRTNPHLLRDMIVTHVRESDASEKQLEALALYMGHSIQMQRTSYDRRTLTRKVAPAVELLQSVNKLSGDEH